MGHDAGTADGESYLARFTNPAGLALGPNGSFLITDHGNHAIRIATPTEYSRAYPDLRPPFVSCSQIRLHDPRTVDGYYTIYYQANLSQPINVWCSDMTGVPKDYVDVPSETNYARYDCSGSMTEGTDIVTKFSRIRLNTTTFRVILDDWAFATSTGNCTFKVHGEPEHVLHPTTNPDACSNTGGLCGQRMLRYGFAASCLRGGDSSGDAMVDLRGTKLAIHKNSTWTAVGYMPDSFLLDVTNNISWTATVRTSLMQQTVDTLPAATGLPRKYVTTTISDPIAQHIFYHDHFYGPTYQVKINGGGACGWTHLIDDSYNDNIVTETHKCMEASRGGCTGFGDVRSVSDNHGLLLRYQPDPDDLVPPLAPKDYNVTTLAGNRGNFGTASGSGEDARFQNPCGIVFDNQSKHSTEQDIYVADYGNHVIRQVNLNGDSIVHLGQIGEWNCTLNPATSADVRLCEPYGLALDTGGNLYLSEYCGHVIRKMEPNGNVVVVAGILQQPGAVDDVGSLAQFNGPKGIALMSDLKLYVADTNNHVVREIDLQTSLVSTLAGIQGQAGYASGIALQALFTFPIDLTVGPEELYVSEKGRVRVIYLNDTVTGSNCTNATITNGTHGSNETCPSWTYHGPVAYLFAGPADDLLMLGQTEGVNLEATFNRPRGLMLHNGELFMADFEEHLIRTIRSRPCPFKNYGICHIDPVSSSEVTPTAGPQCNDEDWSWIQNTSSNVTYNVTSGCYDDMAAYCNTSDVSGDCTLALSNSNYSCPFKRQEDVCMMDIMFKPVPVCNASDWAALKEADLLSQGTATTPIATDVSDICTSHLRQYCYVNGLVDKACSLVNITCPTKSGASAPCSGHGSCNRLTGICKCDPMWFLDNCSSSVCPISPFGLRDCNPPFGSCNPLIPACECVPGSYGETCEFKTCDGNCTGNGSCDPTSGVCTCEYPWGGPTCSENIWYVHPVSKIHSAEVYDNVTVDLTWWNITRWDYHSLEVNLNLSDTLINRELVVTLFKERLGVIHKTEPHKMMVWTAQAYPIDHILSRSISVCPNDFLVEDPRYKWVIGIRAPAGTPYTIQFNITKTLIPLTITPIVSMPMPTNGTNVTNTTYTTNTINNTNATSAPTTNAPTTNAPTNEPTNVNMTNTSANYSNITTVTAFNSTNITELVVGEFVVETYGIRYMHFERLVEHQQNHSFMWLDIEVLEGSFNSIRVLKDTCPVATNTEYHYLMPRMFSWDTEYSALETALDFNLSTWPTDTPTGETTSTNRFRLELFDCSSPAGVYFIAVDARTKFVKAKMSARVYANDHRCQTISPPMREEILVTFGQVVELTAPIAIGVLVLGFILFFVIRYCVIQNRISASHRERIDRERYNAMDASEYFMEEKDDSAFYETKHERRAVSSFQLRKSREVRLEKEIVKAQMQMDGYANDEDNKAMY